MARFRWCVVFCVSCINPVGCFNPDLSNVAFTCDPVLAPACPDGYICASDGVCRAAGVLDGGKADGGTDLAQPPTVEGCAGAGGVPGVGFDVTLAGKPKSYACPAVYKNKQGQSADTLCRAPYVVCSSAASVDLAKCDQIGTASAGFFVASSPAHRTSATQVACGAPSGLQSGLWSGCGSSAVDIQCQGFKTALECFSTSAFQCFGTTIKDTINTDARSGVLCCAP